MTIDQQKIEVKNKARITNFPNISAEKKILKIDKLKETGFNILLPIYYYLD
jgi:hypothetical protein